MSGSAKSSGWMQRVPVASGTKHCTRCDTTKPLDEFGPNRASGDGRQHYCRPCHRQNSAVAQARFRAKGEIAEEVRAAVREINQRLARIEAAIVPPAVREPVKQCPRCKVTKKLEEFPRMAWDPAKHSAACRECQS